MAHMSVNLAVSYTVAVLMGIWHWLWMQFVDTYENLQFFAYTYMWLSLGNINHAYICIYSVPLSVTHLQHLYAQHIYFLTTCYIISLYSYCVIEEVL